MKRIIIVLVALLIVSCNLFALEPSRSTAIGIGTKAQTDASDLGTCAGSLYVNDHAEFDGFVRFDGSSTTLTSTIKELKYTDLRAKTTFQYTPTQLNVFVATWTVVLGTGIVNGVGIVNNTWEDRNVVCTIDGERSGVLGSSDVVVCSVVIEGYDTKGALTTETLVGSKTATSDLYGNVAWSQILGATWTITEIRGADFGTQADKSHLYLNIGSGDKIGINADMHTATDFLKGMVDEVDEKSSFTLNTTYDTWTHSDVPDAGDDYYLKIKVYSGF